MNKNQNVEIHVNGNTQTLEILHGEAQKRPEPLPVVIDGLITAPADYLTKRAGFINQKKSHLLVNYSKGELKLIINEKWVYNDTVKGSLKLNPDFESFGINSGKSRDTFELADFIKMNRHFFSDKNVAMKLVSLLKNFKAKVKNALEASNNDRGDTRLLREQVVESNIPESFDLVIPVFAGQGTDKFKVEINIDGNSFACTLVSPEVNDIIHEVRGRILDEQLTSIKELAPELAILEV